MVTIFHPLLTESPKLGGEQKTQLSPKSDETEVARRCASRRLRKGREIIVTIVAIVTRAHFLLFIIMPVNVLRIHGRGDDVGDDRFGIVTGIVTIVTLVFAPSANPSSFGRTSCVSAGVPGCAVGVAIRMVMSRRLLFRGWKTISIPTLRSAEATG